ncbi:collagen alpha-1(II) chain-like [Schistocerca cancellata]|uniref:collagen alpha-1(II) chain-like n=1 Tax=Schistocerca cancellata TaxID=274614 RepID=UPI00211789A8|nr:collagen alpha-1(II) chain-like [Schistocerca cancellata]
MRTKHCVIQGTPTEPLLGSTAGNPLAEDEQEAAGDSVPKAGHVVVEQQCASTAAGSRGRQDCDPQKTDGEGSAWRARRRKQFSPKKRAPLAEYVLLQSYEEWTLLPETSSGSPHKSPDSKKAGKDSSVGRTRRRKQQQPKKWVSLARLSQHQHQQQHHDQHVCCLHGPGCSSQAGAESQLPGTSSTLPGGPRERGQPTASQEVGDVAEQVQLLQNPPAARLVPPFARQVPVAPLEPPPPPPPANRAAARKPSDAPGQSGYRSPGLTQASPPGLQMSVERSLRQIFGMESGTGLVGVHGRGAPPLTRGLTFAAGKISREAWGPRPVQGYFDPEALADALAPSGTSRAAAAAAAGCSPGAAASGSSSSSSAREAWGPRPVQGYFDPEALADALALSGTSTAAAAAAAAAAGRSPGAAVSSSSSSPSAREAWGPRPVQGYFDPEALADALAPSGTSRAAAAAGRSPSAAVSGSTSSPSAREQRTAWPAPARPGGSLFPLRWFFGPQELADALTPSDQPRGAASHPPGTGGRVLPGTQVTPARRCALSVTTVLDMCTTLVVLNMEQREAPPQQGFLDPAALADALEQSPESRESGGSSRRTTGAGGGPPARRAV